jgi:hypothetical protein
MSIGVAAWATDELEDMGGLYSTVEIGGRQTTPATLAALVGARRRTDLERCLPDSKVGNSFMPGSTSIAPRQTHGMHIAAPQGFCG